MRDSEVMFCDRSARINFVLLILLFSSACFYQHAPSAQSTPQSRSPSEVSSAQQAVRTNIGFASHQKLLEHYQKHGSEFGSVSIEEYLLQAQTLRDRQAGGGLLEFVRTDGVITRYDRSSGAFIAFNSDGTIRTYFKPNAGESYFNRQRERE